jgi:peptidase M23-like protein
MILALIPNRRIRPSTSLFFAAGSLFLVIELVRILWPVPAADTVVLDPPFRGEWYVFQGGRSALVNHHFPLRSQRHALDLLKPREIDRTGQERSASPALETYPSFGQTLYAPAAGRVVRAVNDRPDMAIGKTDSKQIVGNHVTIDIGGGRYVLMAHLMQNSVLVEPGEEVRSGQAIGRCGNSGNTSEPHLHLQAQSDADFQAEGLRTYPIAFRGVVRRRAGRSESLERADLRRNDVVIAYEW